jgi:phage-related protein
VGVAGKAAGHGGDRKSKGYKKSTTLSLESNLQALQNSKVSSFSDLPDWVNQGSASEKALKGHDLKGARQLTIKHRNSYRVAYIAEFEDVVVVLHCFKKQTEGRQSKDMKTVAARLAGAYAEFGYKT